MKLLLKFLSKHLNLFNKQDLQGILLRKTVNGHLLELTVCCHIGYSTPYEELLTFKSYNPEGLKILLEFLNEHSDRIDKKTIQLISSS